MDIKIFFAIEMYMKHFMTPELTSCYSYCHITYILVGTYYITYNLLICIILLVCFFPQNLRTMAMTKKSLYLLIKEEEEEEAAVETQVMMSRVEQLVSVSVFLSVCLSVCLFILHELPFVIFELMFVIFCYMHFISLQSACPSCDMFLVVEGTVTG